MQMSMVVFNRLRGALESLRMSTDLFLVNDCVVARIEGRLKRRLSRKTVEYEVEYSTRGDAMARNWKHAIAFTPERPSWPAPPSYGLVTEWQEVRIPRTLLAGLAQDFLRYHGVIPWDQYCINDRIVTVWVAVPIVAAWDGEGHPVFVQEEPQPETEPETPAEGPIVPPLEVPPPPQWPDRAE